MNLFSLLAIPFFSLAVLSPTVEAQRPIGAIQRLEAAIQTETRIGLAEMDAVFSDAQRRIIQLAERGAPDTEVRAVARRAARDLGGCCQLSGRTVREIEMDGCRVLVRLGAERPLVERFERAVVGAYTKLDRHEALLTARLTKLLDRLL